MYGEPPYLEVNIYMNMLLLQLQVVSSILFKVLELIENNSISLYQWLYCSLT
jgi:hypothetical protein